MLSDEIRLALDDADGGRTGEYMDTDNRAAFLVLLAIRNYWSDTHHALHVHWDTLTDLSTRIIRDSIEKIS